MKRSWKVAAAGAALTAAVATSGAFAQVVPAVERVANTSQKGSVLIYARIDVRPGYDTIVRMSNDNNTAVDVKCYYLNEHKARRDFEIRLTKKQPVWWSVWNGVGTPGVSVNEFPTDVSPTPPIVLPAGGVPNPFLGELICFAVDKTGFDTIRFNHLSGNATIYNFADLNGASAFQYNSWNFKALAAGPVVGVPGAGVINLDGTDYDHCPSYLIGHFSPAGTILVNRDGPITIHRNDLSTVSCNQNLRQDFAPSYTKLELTVWNEYEVKYTGAWECSDGYHFFDLTTADAAPNVFTRAVLKTDAAMLMVQGKASTRCLASTGAGLVGVLSSLTNVGEIGTTLNAAGAQDGRFLWDPQPLNVPEQR